jgi:kinesin family protein 11
VIQCNELHREIQLTQSVNKKEYSRKYHFDRVYDPDTSQERLYETAVAPMVDEVLQGFNCTVFAYGQTGTGKTHTMTGNMACGGANQSDAGVIPRAVGHIFRYLNGLGGVNEFTVKCSFLELYNEEITDLLAVGEESPKVRIMEDPRSGVVLQGLEEPHVKTATDVFSLLETGNARRRTAETLLNKQSSRSHSVFIVTVSVREVLAEGEEVIRVGKLYLVDLAGSENITRSGAVDQRAKEAGNINKSLLTLGRVITALVEGQVHVPYRDSKLTRLLRDSLGGRTKTCIIATIAPTVQCQEETMSTLDYAHRAKNIKNKPEVNQKISKTTHLKEMGGEIARLKAELVAAREKNGVYLPVAQYEEDQARLKEQAERLEVLEVQSEQLEAELSMTKAELEAAQQDIAEGQYIIEQQRQCEDALGKYAVDLTRGLSSALSDVSQLFARVDAKNAQEESNAKMIGNLATNISNQVKDMDAALHATIVAQTELLNDARGEFHELSSLQKKMLSETEKSASDAKSNICCMVENIQDALAKLYDSGASSVEGIAGAVSEFQVKSEASVKVASKKIDGIMKELHEKMEAEQSALDEMRSKQEESGNALRLAVANFVGELGAAMDKITVEVVDMKDKLNLSLNQNKEKIALFKDHHQGCIAQGGDELVKQIAALVANFTSSQQNNVNKFCDEIHGKLESDGMSTEKNMDAVTEAGNMAAIVLKTNQSSLNAVQDAAECDASACHRQVKEQGELAWKIAASMHDESTKLGKKSRDVLKTFAKEVQAQADGSAKSLDELKALESKNLGESGNLAIECCDKLRSKAVEGENAQQELVNRLLQSAEAGVNDLDSFAAEHKSDLKQVASDVLKANDDFLLDEERNNVPHERPEPPFPDEGTVQSLFAPSLDTLSRKFRGTLGSSISDGDLESPEDGEGQVVHPIEEENVGPNLKEVEPVRVTSPEHTKVTTRKRGRSAKNVTESESPPKATKLKAAFELGESRRRGTRRTSSRPA